jgi:nitric oxide reductase subunit B
MKKNWWQPLLLVLVVGMTGVMLMGIRTYQDAPPIPDFATPSGETVSSNAAILQGQAVFQKYALMDYGSMFGDGASRGPDFTAEALHQIAVVMEDYYTEQGRVAGQPEPTPLQRAAIQARVKHEIKENRYDPATGTVRLTEGQAHAYQELVKYYAGVFQGQHREAFQPAAYITDTAELRNLTAFFYWGAWVCGVERPGKAYSYTHNWPYDAAAGNLPSASVTFWSVFGLFGLILALGGVLYIYGRADKWLSFNGSDRAHPIITVEGISNFTPAPLQRATYKFFAVAAVLFLVQVLAGVLTIHDFLRFTTFFGVDISVYLPITIVRGWHVQIALLWISACWIGAAIFVLPLISREQPKGQLALVNSLFGLLVVIVVGSSAGVLLGPKGMLGAWWRWLGNQGWEFVELGRLWQVLLFGAFALWAVIMWRGVRPALRGREPWSLPYWMLYAVVSILLLFIAGFVAGPQTNFVIADFWRWAVIHMWVEAFFEVFTTVIVAYFMYLMGLASQQSAARVVYLATLLFLGSGILGISHNFYWNAKPVMTLAIGSIFSTLQVVPLILLTLEAWRLRQLPGTALREANRTNGARALFGQSEAFLFLLAVNFWNFMGAGVFGLIINLPIVNYYEHGTYLTVNHGHAALMGVYGNLSLAAIMFCCRYLITAEFWHERLVRCSFWSLNFGLALMVVLDLFPAGIWQFIQTLDHGLWYARSQEFIRSTPFQTLTWLRAVGGVWFTLGGIVPVVWFMLSRWRALKPAEAVAPETFVAVPPVAEQRAA